MTLTSEYIQNLLTFPFRDAKWKEKMLVGSLIAFASFIVPFIPQLLLTGYGVQMARRMVLEKAEPHLPEWNDWGALLMDGLRIVLAQFIYLLPIFVPLFVGYGALFFSTFAGALLAESGRMAEDTAALFGLSGFLLFFCMFAVMFILALPLSLILPAATMHAAVKQEFAAAFRFREWWPIFRANLTGYILGYILLMGLYVVSIVFLQIIYFTIILCFILPLIMAVYMYYGSLIYEALFAQIYREGVQKLAAP